MTDEGVEYSRVLAEFCSGISFDDLPPEVVAKAKLCVLDYVANVYGSLELDAVQRVVSYYRNQAAGGGVSVPGCGFLTGVRDAAFLSGIMAEAVEAQDGVRFGGNHPVSAVMPAVLTSGEWLGSSGTRVLEAIVAGYEAANRVAAAVHPFHTLSGFLPTGTCGSFGAAAASSRLMGFDADRTLNALGNAGYLLPISMAEHLMGGYSVKITQGGQAAVVGMGAAALADAGIEGHPKVLEGTVLKGGFTQITVRAEPVLEHITEGLGERYTIMDVYFKPYTACRHTHGAAQAALALKEKYAIDPAEVQSVLVRTYAVAALATGKGVPEGGGFVSAQFSIPYVVAACLTDSGMGPLQLTPQRIADPALRLLSEKVTVEPDDGMNAMYPDKTASMVEITLSDGRHLEELVEIPKGDPRDPMETDDIMEKLKRFSGDRDDANTRRIIDMVLGLEGLGDVSELTGSI